MVYFNKEESDMVVKYTFVDGSAAQDFVGKLQQTTIDLLEKGNSRPNFESSIEKSTVTININSQQDFAKLQPTLNHVEEIISALYEYQSTQTSASTIKESKASAGDKKDGGCSFSCSIM